ncbi:MAG TPA: hypothetical protein VE826_03445 [Dongiaceae bacterium]|nr:hypothetical protein [Dongiaceae bacterium]
MRRLVSLLLAVASALAFLTTALPARAQETPPPCPGDTVVWVYGDKFYPNGPATRLPHPGRYACRRDAKRDGYSDFFDQKSGGGGDFVVLDSVYDAMDGAAHRERAGYGRYTYVLLTGTKDAARNEALLSALMTTMPRAATMPTPPKYLNVFEIPETAAYWTGGEKKGMFPFALEHYDFGMAHALLVKACAAPSRPAVCEGDLAGPFLLTYGRPLESLDRANPPYLIVDLHRLNVKGFVHMIALMKQQVKGANVADAHLVEGMQVQLLSTTLDMSDWLPNLVSSVKSITSLVAGK